MSESDRLRHAEVLYEQAVFGGDRSAPDTAERELDALEADLALARGRVLHARFLAERRPDARELELFERALGLYRALGDRRGEGEALFWAGTYHQVVREEFDKAVPCFARSYDLAEAAGDALTLSYATRHLAFAAMAADRTEEARGRFEHSLRLREELGFRPGVAAAQLSLAEFLYATGSAAEGRSLLAEARRTAEECGAHGTLAWIEEAAARLSG